MSLINKKLHIGGMTCVHCQNKIELALSQTPGIYEARVSYNTGTASFKYDTELISMEEIITIIETLDYDVLPEGKESSPDITRMVCILVIIIALYILLQQFGILNLLVPGELADSKMGYGMLFVVGLLTSVHCIAMCGGINLSQCIPQGESNSGDHKLSFLVPSFLYNLGRVISYTVIGFILGVVGMILGGGSGSGLPTLLQGILKLIAGVFMVIMGINMLGIFPWLKKLNLRMPKFLAVKIGQQKMKRRQPLIVGLFNGLMPCGPLQSMQIVALASGNPFAGALSMFLFSLGTVPLMLGLGSVVSALGRKFTQKVMSIGAVLVTVLGLAMLAQGGSLSGLLLPERLLILVIVLAVLGVAASVPADSPLYKATSFAAVLAVVIAMVGGGCLHIAAGNQQEVSSDAEESEIVDGVQVVNSTLSPGKYPNITVQAGTPVKWVIDAPEGSINGCNHKMILQDFGIEYSFEEGENVIEFTPTEAGTYSYSCWMGMIHGNIFVTDGSGETSSGENETGDASSESGENEESDSTAVPVPAGYQIPSDELAVAEMTEDEEGNSYQEVSVELTDDGFSPAVIVVQSGIPTVWNIEVSLSGSEDGVTLLAPTYSTSLVLDGGENGISLYPTESFDVSTDDNRFYAYVKVVEDINEIDTAAIQEEVDAYETYIYPDSIFESSGTGGSCCAH